MAERKVKMLYAEVTAEMERKIEEFINDIHYDRTLINVSIGYTAFDTRLVAAVTYEEQED